MRDEMRKDNLTDVDAMRRDHEDAEVQLATDQFVTTRARAVRRQHSVHRKGIVMRHIERRFAFIRRAVRSFLDELR